MRYRLTKRQAQMLLDGKPLRSGKTRFHLSKENSEIRDFLQNWIDDGCKFAVFLKDATGKVSLEIE